MLKCFYKSAINKLHPVFLFLDMCIFSVVAADQPQNIYTESDDEFDDVETPIGQCTALYNFEGTF